MPPFLPNTTAMITQNLPEPGITADLFTQIPPTDDVVDNVSTDVSTNMPTEASNNMSTNAAELPPEDLAEEPKIQEARLWCYRGWTARVIKNEDDEGWAVAMTRDGEWVGRDGCLDGVGFRCASDWESVRTRIQR